MVIATTSAWRRLLSKTKDSHISQQIYRFYIYLFILHTWNPSTVDNCFQISGIEVVIIEYGFGCWVDSFNCLSMFLPPFSGNNDAILISNVIKCPLVSHCVSHIVSQSPCSFQTFIQQVWSLAQFYQAAIFDNQGSIHEMGFLSKRFALVVLDSDIGPGTSVPSATPCLRSSGSKIRVRGKIQGCLRAQCQLKKPFKGPGHRKGNCQEE